MSNKLVALIVLGLAAQTGAGRRAGRCQQGFVEDSALDVLLRNAYYQP